MSEGGRGRVVEWVGVDECGGDGAWIGWGVGNGEGGEPAAVKV